MGKVIKNSFYGGPSFCCSSAHIKFTQQVRSKSVVQETRHTVVINPPLQSGYSLLLLDKSNKEKLLHSDIVKGR